MKTVNIKLYTYSNKEFLNWESLKWSEYGDLVEAWVRGGVLSPIESVWVAESSRSNDNTFGLLLTLIDEEGNTSYPIDVKEDRNSRGSELSGVREKLEEIRKAEGDESGGDDADS